MIVGGITTEGGAAQVPPAGPQGPSAYDVAVANGFTGTVQQWLVSLQGPSADPTALNAAISKASGQADNAAASAASAAASLSTITSKISDAVATVMAAVTDALSKASDFAAQAIQSAAAAAKSAMTASGAATSATTQASAASTSASAASSSASAASNSATSAGQSSTAAANSAALAAQSARSAAGGGILPSGAFVVGDIMVASTPDGLNASDGGLSAAVPAAPPSMDGVAAVGTAKTLARSDHVHPSDATRLAVTGALSEIAGQGSVYQLAALQNIGALTPGQILALALTN